jgi:thiamine pyrophosphokinase
MAASAMPKPWAGAGTVARRFRFRRQQLEDRFGDVRRQIYPSEKALSDGEIAIRHALDEGADDPGLVGALGGERSDHAIFNLTGASSLAQERPDCASC